MHFVGPGNCKSCGKIDIAIVTFQIHFDQRVISNIMSEQIYEKFEKFPWDTDTAFQVYIARLLTYL